MKNIIYAAICFFSLNGSLISAQPGTLDQSFGNGGKVFNETFTGYCTAIALQDDGKIITGGLHESYQEDESGVVIARFNADGSLDEGFGDAGKLIITEAEGSSPSYIVAIAVQKDGKIIVCGSFFSQPEGADLGIVRLKSNGTFDSSFSDNGIGIYRIGKNDIIGDMALEADGKVVATGMKDISDGNFEGFIGFVTRILPDGLSDESFGESGIVLAPVNSIYRINAIAVQTDNKIVIAGPYLGGSLFVIRYLSNGILDSTFDEDKDGIAGIRFDDEDVYYAGLNDISIQADGKILAAATAGSLNYEMAVIRFKSDGSVDSAFGNKTGYSVLPMGRRDIGIAKSVIAEADKKIVLTGFYYTGDNTGFGAVKYNTDGSLDSTFGENGIAVSGFDSLYILEVGHGVVQKDGKIIVGGAAYPAGEHDFTNVALVRFNNEIVAKPPEFAKIKKWQGHYGFTWKDWPGNKTSYYSVGRSTDASVFTEIMQVADVKGQKSYQYEDATQLSGIVYYRLTAVRTDGVSVNSNVIACGDDLANNFVKLYPNPAKNSLRIEGLSATEKTKLTVLDFSGNAKMITTVTGNYNLNVAALKPGNYMLVIETKGNVVTKKFVKQ